MRARAQEHGPVPDVEVEERAGARNAPQGSDARLGTAAARLQALTHADGVAIALQAEDVIRCRASAGDAPEVGTPVRLDRGLSAICIRTAAAVCCADTEHDERADAASCRTLNLRSVVLAPVLAQDSAAVGLVACFWSRPRAFDREIVAAVTFLAEALSTARGQSVSGPMHAASGGARRRMRVAFAICSVILVAAVLYRWRHSRNPQVANRAAPPVVAALNAPTAPVSTLVALPVLVSRIEPEYPRSALARATERVIVLDLTVDRDGRVDQVKIVKGDPVLAIVAAGAVARWRYRAGESPDPAFRMRTRVNLQLP